MDRPHDYGTCVYAMSMAAVAAFRYVASELGVTGFQASCADMDILRRTRRMERGFQIIDYANLLYPQYWNEETTPIYQKVLADDPERWRDAAAEALSQMSEHGSDAVREHLRGHRGGGRMTPERVPVLYFNRCGHCGAYEGTVDPNEPCPIDPTTGEPLGPHQFGIYERVGAPDEDVPRPSHIGAQLPDDLPF